jgi:hypothetical protein
MLTTAEVRWFWPEHCPQQLHDWFFQTGLPPSGGHSRIDRYIPQPNEPELSVKQRGDKPGLEFKGLVTTHRSPVLDALAGHLEIWCKWSCSIPGLNLKDEVAIAKKRWLRQFDTSKTVRVELPLDANEKPSTGYSLPAQGCNAKLTEVQILSRSGVWWTLGFEAFGNLDTVPISLTRVLQPEKLALTSIVASGAFLSYPAWLLRTLAD